MNRRILLFLSFNFFFLLKFSQYSKCKCGIGVVAHFSHTHSHSHMRMYDQSFRSDFLLTAFFSIYLSHSFIHSIAVAVFMEQLSSGVQCTVIGFNVFRLKSTRWNYYFTMRFVAYIYICNPIVRSYTSVFVCFEQREREIMMLVHSVYTKKNTKNPRNMTKIQFFIGFDEINFDKLLRQSIRVSAFFFSVALEMNSIRKLICRYFNKIIESSHSFLSLCIPFFLHFFFSFIEINFKNRIFIQFMAMFLLIHRQKFQIMGKCSGSISAHLHLCSSFLASSRRRREKTLFPSTLRSSPHSSRVKRHKRKMSSIWRNRNAQNAQWWC